MAVAIETVPSRGLDSHRLRLCAEVHWRVWPMGDDLDQRCARWSTIVAAAGPDDQLHLAYVGGRVGALAITFPRVIAVAGHRLTVMALAGVCSDPAHRGNGLGKAVVLAAFARLGAELPVAFFQTGVPEFYSRLGSRAVANRVVTSVGTRAFWEPHAMIHPATAAWPDGEIDLLGEGW
jgi:predicted N-acetyltransferase YhbS